MIWTIIYNIPLNKIIPRSYLWMSHVTINHIIPPKGEGCVINVVGFSVCLNANLQRYVKKTKQKNLWTDIDEIPRICLKWSDTIVEDMECCEWPTDFRILIIIIIIIFNALFLHFLLRGKKTPLSESF